MVENKVLAMLPISDNVLLLNMVAEYWSREIAGVRTTADIHGQLLLAFWQDQLAVFGSSGETRVDRRCVPGSVRSQSKHPGFRVVDSLGMIPPRTEDHPDGGTTIDLTNYIVLLPDESLWTDDLVEAAFRTLATMSFEDFHDLLKPGLRAFSTTQEALSSYCDLMGYPLPRFWFRSGRNDKWTARREREVERWFQQITEGRKHKSKSAYRAEAAKIFDGLPSKAFNRIWDRLAPEDWRRSGPVIRSTR